MTPTLRVLGDPAFRNEQSNAYNALLYRHMIEQGADVAEFSPQLLMGGAYPIWHVHWPETPLATGSRKRALRQCIARLRLIGHARWRGVRIIWTTHNIRSHDQRYPRLERILWKLFIPFVDGYISPSRAAQVAAVDRFPRLNRIPGFVVPLGHFRKQFGAPIETGLARASLGLPGDGKVTLFFGQIRNYKNVPGLISAFGRLNDPFARLVIAGKPHPTVDVEDLHLLSRGDPRVHLDLRTIPDGELRVYLSAADLVILPFKDILNSGSVLLALSLDRPVLVPGIGGMVELQETVGPDWVRTYIGSLTEETIADALRWATETRRTAPPALDSFDWNLVASQTIRACQAICGMTSDASGAT